jgi:transposase-like protein
MRDSLNCLSWKQQKTVPADLRQSYAVATVDEGQARLADFGYSPEIRSIIYSTNAIEWVNKSLRKTTKDRRSFPSDQAVLKLFYLALMNISQKWVCLSGNPYTVYIKFWMRPFCALRVALFFLLAPISVTNNSGTG